MLRAACRWVSPVAVLAAMGVPHPAAASDPFTTYVVPSLVEMQPSEEAATRVVIHGAFFHLTSTSAFTYSDARCGVMYFQCATGQEVMCRMQWQELKAAIVPAPAMCRGFGNRQVVSTATVYAEGQSLGAPDPWDLGMGIGLGSSVDGKCPPATRLSCPAAGGRDGGATDAAGGAGGRGTGGATAGTGGAAPGSGGATAGTGGAPGSGGATVGTGGATATGGAPATGGASATGGATASTGGAPATGGAGAAGAGGRSTGGCALGGAPSRSPWKDLLVVTSLGGGALVVVGRARRRRSR